MWCLSNTQPINNRITVFSWILHDTFTKKYCTSPTHFWTVLLCADNKGSPYSWSYHYICLASFIMDWIIGHLNSKGEVYGHLEGQAVATQTQRQHSPRSRAVCSGHSHQQDRGRTQGAWGRVWTRAVVSGVWDSKTKAMLTHF